MNLERSKEGGEGEEESMAEGDMGDASGDELDW